MYLFVALAFPVVLLPITELADRLGLLLTLILTAITFTLFIREHLPKVSYMTKLDQYTIVCYLVIAALCMESSAVYLLSKTHPDSDWIASIEFVEDWTACFTFAIWTLIHVVVANSNLCDAKTAVERQAGSDAVYDPLPAPAPVPTATARSRSEGDASAAPKVAPADGGDSSLVEQQLRLDGLGGLGDPGASPSIVDLGRNLLSLLASHPFLRGIVTGIAVLLLAVSHGAAFSGTIETSSTGSDSGQVAEVPQMD